MTWEIVTETLKVVALYSKLLMTMDVLELPRCRNWQHTPLFYSWKSHSCILLAATFHGHDHSTYSQEYSNPRTA